MQPCGDHVSMPDLTGEYYHLTLSKLHQLIQPRVYLEIGTEHGETLGLSTCAAIAVDPQFRFRSSDLLKTLTFRKFLYLHHTSSDEFFEEQQVLKPGLPTPLFVFLDGLHLCEALLKDFINVERLSDKQTVVAIHDVAPVEVGMVSRNQYPSPMPTVAHRLGWWTGDVWKFALLLKQERPDLNIVVLDCPPTGLMLVGNLDPNNAVFRDGYDASCVRMDAMSLETMGVAALHRELELISTAQIDGVSDIHSLLGSAAI